MKPSLHGRVWMRCSPGRAIQHVGPSLEARDRLRLVEWICNDEGYLKAWQAPRPPGIAIEAGFDISRRKTRCMFRSRQQALTGIVVNRTLNVRRQGFDTLKAVLTNCLREGPMSQYRDGARDFKAHLAGRIAHVASRNAARGERLKDLFRRIDWAG